MKWAPNPYALAQLMSGRTDVEDFVTQSGEDLDKVLIDAFVSRGKHKTVSEAFAAFRQVAEFNQPLTLENAMRSPHVNRAAIGRSDDQFRLMVPALLRISDDIFEGHVFAASEAVLIDDVSYRDPEQGLIGDCYLIAAMIALAWAAPKLMTQRLSAIRLQAGQTRFFRWQFHSNDAESSLRGDISVTRPDTNGRQASAIREIKCASGILAGAAREGLRHQESTRKHAESRVRARAHRLPIH